MSPGYLYSLTLFWFKSHPLIYRPWGRHARMYNIGLVVNTLVTLKTFLQKATMCKKNWCGIGPNKTCWSGYHAIVQYCIDSLDIFFGNLCKDCALHWHCRKVAASFLATGIVRKVFSIACSLFCTANGSLSILRLKHVQAASLK